MTAVLPTSRIESDADLEVMLKGKLAELSSERGSLTDLFARAGIKARPMCADGCAVALWLAKELERACLDSGDERQHLEVMVSERACYAQVCSDNLDEPYEFSVVLRAEVATPPKVAFWIARFDAREFPELLAS